MKISLKDSRLVSSDNGHTVHEMLGLVTQNIAKYSVAHIVAEAGSTGTTRQNQFDEILIVVSGSGTIRQDYTSHELGPKDVLLLPAGARYTLTVDAGENMEMWALCVPAFRPEWSDTGTAKKDWRDYRVPRGADRLREIRKDPGE